MIPVEEIVDGDLPVAVDDVLLDAVHGFDRAVGHEQPQADAADLSQIVVKRRRFGIERREVEAVGVIDLCRLGESPLRLVEVLSVVGRQARYADQVSVQVVVPAVIGADERFGIALLGTAKRVAAMAAG